MLLASSRRVGVAASSVRGARLLHALIMGPPGGGKGTLSKRIETDFGFRVLSAGDVLRAQVCVAVITGLPIVRPADGRGRQVAKGTEVGRRVEATLARGELVPTEVIRAARTPRHRRSLPGR